MPDSSVESELLEKVAAIERQLALYKKTGTVMAVVFIVVFGYSWLSLPRKAVKILEGRIITELEERLPSQVKRQTELHLEKLAVEVVQRELDRQSGAQEDLVVELRDENQETLTKKLENPKRLRSLILRSPPTTSNIADYIPAIKECTELHELQIGESVISETDLSSLIRKMPKLRYLLCGFSGARWKMDDLANALESNGTQRFHLNIVRVNKTIELNLRELAAVTNLTELSIAATVGAQEVSPHLKESLETLAQIENLLISNYDRDSIRRLVESLSPKALKSLKHIEARPESDLIIHWFRDSDSNRFVMSTDE